MILTLRRIAMPGFALLFCGLLGGLTGPIALSEPPIGESMSPSDTDFLPARGNLANLSEIRSVTCQTYSPESFADSFCGFEPTGDYGGEFPAVRLDAAPLAPTSGSIDNPRDFSYIQLDGNWVSKEHSQWRIPQIEVKL